MRKRLVVKRPAAQIPEPEEEEEDPPQSFSDFESESGPETCSDEPGYDVPRTATAQGQQPMLYDEYDSDQEEFLLQFQEASESSEEQQRPSQLCRAVPELLPPCPSAARTPISDDAAAAEAIIQAFDLLESRSLFDEHEQQ